MSIYEVWGDQTPTEDRPKGMVPTKGWKPKRAILAPLLPRWLKRRWGVRHFLRWLDIRAGRYILNPYVPEHVSEVGIKDWPIAGVQSGRVSCKETNLSARPSHGWKPCLDLQEGDRVLHNAQARDGRYWSDTVVLLGTVRSVNGFTKLVDVAWDDGVEREPLPPSVLYKDRWRSRGFKLGQETPKPKGVQIAPGDDVLARHKEWEESRIFNKDNPPTMQDVTEIAPNLYRATDDTLWEIGPECCLRPHRLIKDKARAYIKAMEAFRVRGRALHRPDPAEGAG